MDLSTSATQFAALVPLTIIILDAIRRYIRSAIERKGCPLPPGPTPLPLLGNVLSINTKEPWLTYTKWRETYGDIMYIRLFDTDVVVLNSRTVAMELLEKRSHIYSDRPFIASVEPYGHDWNFAFKQYGEHWRLCRRMFHQEFRAEAALTFRPMQLRRARQMIVNMIDCPEEYLLHCWTFASGVALSAVFDYEPKLRNDPMVLAIHDFLQASFPILTPERALLKAFPSLLNIPDWLPGSWIKREARATRVLRDMVETPYQDIRRRMESKDTINDTMVINQTKRIEKLDSLSRVEHETALKHASFTAFIGSAETTSSTITVFMLAMVKNPHMWKRAQTEIDAVVGVDRLPEFGDRQSLPYVDAIVRETLRWKPLTPLGIAHATTTEDIYKGFYIPKGATVLANIWAMSYDEARYPDPEVFCPERFLDAQGLLIKDDPTEFVFGFGRRMCPGRPAADASVWSAIATMLATLEFSPAKDGDGNNIAFEATFTTGLTLHPIKFPCSLTPRTHVTREDLARTLAG